MTAGDADVARLLARFEQRSEALEREVQRGQELERERSRLLEAEHEAASRAAAAHQHLRRLQRVTSALSEAVTVGDVRRVLHSAMADAVGAERVYLALPSDEGGPLWVLGDEERLRATTGHEGLDAPADVITDLEAAYSATAALWPAPRLARVALPLFLGARRLGAVVFELSQARELTDTDRALFEDLTRQLALALDRAKMYELAKLSCARAEEANLAKDEFLAMLGHELRNPLSPMLTAVTLMQSRLGDQALKERQIIQRQLHHMVRLVDDLLDVSRITRGTLELSRRRVELAKVVERAVEMASPMLDARRHQLTLAVPSIGLPVLVDTHRLAQAVANLLTNAAKYTPSGGSIEVSSQSCAGQVVLSVRDDGVGMDDSLLRRVFEPFVQRQQAIDRAGGGLGLGLTIARRLVELHGGAITAASAGPGRGSTFNIELTLEGAAQAVPVSSPGPDSGPRACTSSTPISEPEAATSARGAPAIRVLVVDDNVDAAEMLAEVLRMGGHEVSVAHDGPSALTLLEHFHPELALLDIGLPVMDGFDLAQHMKARLNGAAPMFVAVTGYGRPADRARTKQVGFDEHLVKPVDLARLDLIVRNVARRRS